MKTAMIASVSHDLRSPLNGIQGMLKSSLNDDSVTDKFKNEYLEPALDCSEYLLFLVNDILVYT